MASGKASILGSLRGRVAQEARQAGKVVLAAQHEREGPLVGKHVLPELRAERRQALGDGGEALLHLGRVAGAGAPEIHVIALEDALLLRRETERVAPAEQGVDAREELVVQIDLVPMTSAQRRDLKLDRLERRIAVRADEVEEHRAGP